jgi:hypothetical protein
MKMIRKIVFKRGLLLLMALLAVLALTATPALAETLVWQPVGSIGFSSGNTDYISLSVSSGTPYVAYEDLSATGYSGPATVMEYVDGSWQMVGGAPVSSGVACYESLYVYNGTPYVAYQDEGNNNKATVMDYVYGSWQPVGSPDFSNGGTSGESLYVYNGTPYLAYCDNNGITVMEYTGGSWQPVGSPDFYNGYANQDSLYVYNGTPYVAYSDSDTGNQATVMEYTGGSWQPVGSPDFSSGVAVYESLYVYNGTPYVAYQDYANGSRATVMEYTGGSWQPVGSPGFFSGYSYSRESLSVYNGTPYLAYIDGSNNQRTTVVEYTGDSWQMVGGVPAAGIYGGFPDSLYIYNGTPYVAYDGGNNDGKATVMEAVPAAPAPAPALTATAAPGSATGTTAVTATPASSDTLAVEVSTSSIAVPNVGDPAPTGSGVTNPYTSGSDVSGVVNGDYVGVYDLSSSGTVVAFTQIQLTNADINSLAAPAVTGISPTSGPAAGGAAVIITGTGFTGATEVNFGATPADSFTVNSDTQITATSPAECAGTVDVTVTTPAVTSATGSADQFTYIAPVLNTLNLSGAPTNLIYNGTPLTLDLSTLTLSGADQLGQPFDLSGQTVSWAATGNVTVNDYILTIKSGGTIGVAASIGSVTSNTLNINVSRGTPVLSTLDLSGNPTLTYNGKPFTFNLSTLTLAGADQFGNSFGISNQTVVWAVIGNATVSGSTLTITSAGQIDVTASIGSVTSNDLSLSVNSSDASLTNLTVNPGTLTPTFSSKRTSYSDTLPYGTTSLSVTAMVYQSNATLTINGITLASGQSSPAISLAPGTTTTIKVLVTAQNKVTTKCYTINVKAKAPVIKISTPLPADVAEIPYSETFTGGGGAAPYTYAESGTLPSGLTLTPGGILSGATTEVGAYKITVTATDADGFTGTRTYNLTVKAPVIKLSPSSLPAVTAKKPYAANLTASGGIAPFVFSIISGALPSGLTLASGGILSGATTPAAAGCYPVTITATDAYGFTGARSYNLTVKS